MSVIQQNFQSYLSTLRLIFFALLMTQIMALSILYSVRLQEAPAVVPELRRLVRLLPVVLGALVAIGFWLHRRKLTEARTQPTLKAKLGQFRTALILRWAPMEVATLLLGVFYFLIGTPFLLYLAGLLLVLFGMQWPNRLDIINDLYLNSDEQMILDDPNAVVAELSRKP